MRRFASILLIICTSLVITSAQAEIAVIPPVAFQGGISPWMGAFRQMMDAASSRFGHMQCAPIKELPDALICLSSDLDAMNHALARASIYAEGAFRFPMHTVLSQKDPSLPSICHMFVQGHDLQAKDLIAFRDDMIKNCALQPDYCANEEEAEFLRMFLPGLRNGATKLVIAFSYLGSSPMSTISHEILHARYFLQEDYRKAVDDFWRTLSVKDQQRIKLLLKDYDAEDEFLIKNEFQAYLLMQNAESEQLGKVLHRFKPRLLAALVRDGIAPLEIN